MSCCPRHSYLILTTVLWNRKGSGYSHFTGVEVLRQHVVIITKVHLAIPCAKSCDCINLPNAHNIEISVSV